MARRDGRRDGRRRIQEARVRDPEVHHRNATLDRVDFPVHDVIYFDNVGTVCFGEDLEGSGALAGYGADVVGVLDQTLSIMRCDRVVVLCSDAVSHNRASARFSSVVYILSWVNRDCTDSNDIGPENRDKVVVPAVIDEAAAEQVRRKNG